MLHTNKQIRREFTATRGLVNGSNVLVSSALKAFPDRNYNDVLLYAEVG